MPESSLNRATGSAATATTMGSATFRRAIGEMEKGTVPQNRATSQRITGSVADPFPVDFESVKKRLGQDIRELLLMTKELDEKVYQAREEGKTQLITSWLRDKDIIKPYGGILLPSAGIKIYEEPKYLSSYPEESDLVFLKHDLQLFERWFWKTARNRLIGLANRLKELGHYLMEVYQVDKDSNYTETTPETFPILDFTQRLDISRKIKEQVGNLPIYIGSFDRGMRYTQEESTATAQSYRDRYVEWDKFINESTFDHKIFRAAWELYKPGDDSISIDQTKSLIVDTIDQYLFKVADDWIERLNSMKELELEKGEWRIFDDFLRVLIDDLVKSVEIEEALRPLCNQIIEHNFETIQEEKSWSQQLAEFAIFIITLLIFKRPMTISIRAILIVLNAAGIVIETADWLKAISNLKEIKTVNKAEIVDKIYQVTSEKFRSDAETGASWATAAFILSLIGTVADISQIKNIPKGRKITIDDAEGHGVELSNPNAAKKAGKKAQEGMFTEKPKVDPVDPKGLNYKGTSDAAIDSMKLTPPAPKSNLLPSFATPEQSEFIEELLEVAEIHGFPIQNQEILANYLKSAKSLSELEEKIEILINNFDQYGRNLLGGQEPFVVDICQQVGKLRYTRGIAKGGEDLPIINDPNGWFDSGTIARIPGQIVKRMRGKPYNSFRHFREEFWKLVEQDPVLRKYWSDAGAVKSLREMAEGRAPFAKPGQIIGRGSNAKLQLNHQLAIEHGGEVYDFDNLEIVSPLFHLLMKQ